MSVEACVKIGRVYSGTLYGETFRVTSVSAFYWRLFSYADEFNKHDIGVIISIQCLIRDMIPSGRN